MPRTMCFTVVSGCSGFAMPSSALRRAQSVLDCIEVDLRLALGGFAERDDADFLFILRVSDRDGHAGQKAERDKSLFAVVESVILKSERRARKYQFGIDKVDTVIHDIAGAFALRS